MNITQQNNDNLTATITLSIVKDDYAANVEKVLKDHRKNAQIQGFRKGNAPMGMIKKQYGMAVQMDEINKLVSQGLEKHISEADYKILGEPLPSESQETLDFDNAVDFDFLFDVGITPDINLDLSDKDEVVYYEITPDADAVSNRIAQMRNQFAEMTNPDTVEAGDMVRGDMAQVDADGNLVEGGLTKDAAVVSPNTISDDAVKAMFIGAKVGANVVFNPSKAMANVSDVAALLGVGAEEVVDADFKMTVTEIVRYVDAEINEDLFTKAFPNEEIKTEEDFNKKIEEEVKAQYASESIARFEWEARDFIVAKLADVSFPEAFLKRWIIASNAEREDFDAEKLEADFSKVLDDVRWQLATSYLAEKAELKVEAEDPMNAAKRMAAQQFAMYGMGSLPEVYLEDYAKKMLEDRNQSEQIINRVMTDKVIDHVKSTVSLKNTVISMADFQKLYEEAKNA